VAANPQGTIPTRTHPGLGQPLKRVETKKPRLAARRPFEHAVERRAAHHAELEVVKVAAADRLQEPPDQPALAQASFLLGSERTPVSVDSRGGVWLEQPNGKSLRVREKRAHIAIAIGKVTLCFRLVAGRFLGDLIHPISRSLRMRRFCRSGRTL